MTKRRNTFGPDYKGQPGAYEWWLEASRLGHKWTCECLDCPPPFDERCEWCIGGPQFIYPGPRIHTQVQHDIAIPD